jgi:hypothetical protein
MTIKLEAYIALQFFDDGISPNIKDKVKIDSIEKLKEYIFLPPEDFQESKDFHDKNQNREKLKRIPLYTDFKEARNDASFFTGQSLLDYGTVRKVTITIEDEAYNTIKEERESLNALIKRFPKDKKFYLKGLKDLEWYEDD